MEIEKEYIPENFEKKWYSFWLKKNYFQADPSSSKVPFCIVIPPPNVTGTLHIGHALNYTLQDIIIRWKRMCGHDVLWLPGTDHAGIATQIVVEKELQKKGQTRQELGREKFVELVWKWKKEYEEKIVNVLKRLGSSCDWSRQRFTLDEQLSRVVREAFVQLYRDGKIYRGQYIVNWCPRCRTAISDLEVSHEDIPGKLYYIVYPIKGEDTSIVVATTRPETMLGDTAVVVNPSDERYTAIVGKSVILPIMNREIPIVADSFADPEFGTGAVKVTPAHDPNDFAISQRLKLPLITVIDEEGKMTQEAGEFKGLDRFKCRKLILERLKKEKRLEKVAEYAYSVGKCFRCNTVIEPYVSTQWFVKMDELAQSAIQAIEEKKIAFIPENWEKTYFEWLRNIHDWCISRQLWWGHRIPAWYCSCGEIMVDVKKPDHCSRCKSESLTQDEDVLDTWFSSSLWPFSTLGWLDGTSEFKRYYPTTTLITGFDIIFFWVARMIMMGIKFTGDVPFHTVYFNGLVRDAQGQKMSKSRGNVIETDELLVQYGTDAVRFTLAILATPGTDIPLSPQRMLGYRAFANKIWNAARFVLRNIPEGEISLSYQKKDLNLVDRWILSELNRLIGEINQNLELYRFDQAAHLLYHFLWHKFCDWFIEFVKPSLLRSHEEESQRQRAVLIDVLDTILKLLHPFMPFITEELWQKLPLEKESIAIAPYPKEDRSLIDKRAEEEMVLLIELITNIRNLRAENNIDPSKKIELVIRSEDKKKRALIQDNKDQIVNLVKASRLRFAEDPISGVAHARCFLHGVEAAIPLKGLIDFAAEKKRLEKEITKLDKELSAKAKKLSNEQFLSKAPPDVIERESRSHQKQLEKREKLIENHALISKAEESEHQ